MKVIRGFYRYGTPGIFRVSKTHEILVTGRQRYLLRTRDSAFILHITVGYRLLNREFHRGVRTRTTVAVLLLFYYLGCETSSSRNNAVIMQYIFSPYFFLLFSFTFLFLDVSQHVRKRDHVIDIQNSSKIAKIVKSQ